MKKGNLYFISDDFFDKFNNQKLMTNKEDEHNRPCYYSLNDDKYEDIYWMIPISSQIDKYEEEFRKSITKYGLCDKISFGYVKGEKNAFLLQNMCPIIEKYILNEYHYRGTTRPVTIPNDLKSELNAKARKLIRKAENGVCIPFTDIISMRNQLIQELDIIKEIAAAESDND
ncbi:MAG TPA: hypothetical protein VJ888_08495 [Mobilitalea sp.]|nr:hypothetical protein [Mobilitalea sp.]